MKIDLNEALEKKYFTEEVNEQIEVVDIHDVEQSRGQYSLSVKLAVNGEAKQSMIDYINKNLPSDEGDAPCTDIKYIMWNKYINAEGVSESYPDYILCDSDDGEFDISHDYYDTEEICKAAGFDEYDVEDAIDKSRNYFDF